ncbi:MAG TPA: AMP-dependent synthetase [Aliiroseovarius sp.]|nr:AMP-dependent synthetase [Aliiroseovarius sp.]
MRAGFRWDIPADFNIATACCDRWAGRDPDRLALTHVGADGAAQDWSYGALKEASDRLAASFAARGLMRGDRVAVLLAQGPEVLITHFAAMKLGAVVLPLFTLFGPDALAFRLADSGARMLVTDAENLGKVEAIRGDLPALAEIYVTDPVALPLRDFRAEIDSARGAPAPLRTRADDPAVLVYTSGTTGPPKGVLHAHRFLMGHLPSIELHHEGFPQPGDKGWTPADWAWVGGLMDLALPWLYYGVPIVSHRMRKFDPEAAFRLIAEQGVRNLFMPPTALKLMQGTKVPAGVDLRSIGSGGESLGAELLEWGRAALGVPINELYGQTECNLVLTSAARFMEVRPGSMGLAVPGHDVAVIDAEGREVATGEVGEIAVRRPDPVMFLEYWKQPEKTAAKFAGDWLKTGDLARRDEDGYFWFVSRDDDVITSSGYRIGPSEIEHCLAGHPDVVMAAVVGVPDPVRTEAVKAVVVARPGAAGDALARDLTQLVRERISPHVAPRIVEFADSLPMTATGKIRRRDLR